MSVSARVAGVRGRYSNIKVRMTMWSRTTGLPPGGAMDPCGLLAESDRRSRDRRRHSSVHATRDGTAGWRIDADALDCAPVELRLAFIVRGARADRFAKLCYGVRSGRRTRGRRSACSEARTSASRSCSSVPPSSDAVPAEQASARRSAVRIRRKIVQENAVPVRRRLIDPDFVRTASSPCTRDPSRSTSAPTAGAGSSRRWA